MKTIVVFLVACLGFVAAQDAVKTVTTGVIEVGPVGSFSKHAESRPTRHLLLTD